MFQRLLEQFFHVRYLQSTALATARLKDPNWRRKRRQLSAHSNYVMLPNIGEFLQCFITLIAVESLRVIITHKHCTCAVECRSGANPISREQQTSKARLISSDLNAVLLMDSLRDAPRLDKCVVATIQVSDA